MTAEIKTQQKEQRKDFFCGTGSVPTTSHCSGLGHCCDKCSVLPHTAGAAKKKKTTTNKKKPGG